MAARRTQGLPGCVGKTLDGGLLYAHFHEDFQANTEHAGGKWIAPDNFREVFAVERHRGLGIWQSEKQTHTYFVT